MCEYLQYTCDIYIWAMDPGRELLGIALRVVFFSLLLSFAIILKVFIQTVRKRNFVARGSLWYRNIQCVCPSVSKMGFLVFGCCWGDCSFWYLRYFVVPVSLLGESSPTQAGSSRSDEWNGEVPATSAGVSSGGECRGDFVAIASGKWWNLFHSSWILDRYTVRLFGSIANVFPDNWRIQGIFLWGVPTQGWNTLCIWEILPPWRYDMKSNWKVCSCNTPSSR